MANDIGDMEWMDMASLYIIQIKKKKQNDLYSMPWCSRRYEIRRMANFRTNVSSC